MKILEWMQKRLNGNNGKKKPSSISATHYMKHEPIKQEFSDWPQAFLAIGTFGTNNVKEDSDRTKTTAEDPPSFQDCVQEFTLEEVGNLQNELSTYFRGPEESNLAAEQEENPNDLINKPLNSEHSSLEEEHEGKENETFSDGSSINRVKFYPSCSLMHSKGKDRCLDNSKSAVRKKSLYFLLKKMFVCKSELQPTPNFIKDPLSTESRMEKILRAVLHKKIYPQGSSSTMFMRKYLETKPMPQSDDDDDYEEFTTAECNGCKWVKTDDEYIVLEI